MAIMDDRSLTLNYAFENTHGAVTLDLFDAERYAPAVIVQQLIGNLVYFSNMGRYEPRLAKAWSRVSDNVWRFELHEGLKAENGEAINALTFKASLERAIVKATQDYPPPTLSDLTGFSEFISGKSNNLSGIRAEDLILTFEFDKPIRDGLLQILSFAPFGYISAQNLNADGSWKDSTKFISSGPYQVLDASPRTGYRLIPQKNWILPFAKLAPKVLNFQLKMPSNVNSKEAWIIDSWKLVKGLPANFVHQPLVPEYLTAVLLGGSTEKSFFADRNNRMIFKRLILGELSKLPKQIDSFYISKSFYPNDSKSDSAEPSSDAALAVPYKPIVLAGSPPPEGSSGYIAWSLVKKVLDDHRIPYEWSKSNLSMSDLMDRDYDIRIITPSVGAGAEAWTLAINFCSEVGPKLPDPTGQICSLIQRYELGEIDQPELAERFKYLIEHDAAIIPVTHKGVQLYLSPSVNERTISPSLCILRFDQLELQ